MDEHGKESLAERVERLEKGTEEVRNELHLVNRKLDRALSGLGQGKVDAEAGTVPAPGDRPVVEKPASRSPSTERRPLPPQQPASRPAAASHEPPRQREDSPYGGSGAGRSFGLPFDLKDLRDFRSGEWWLNKIGIGLLLFGVAFLYLLSEERGWIGPPVRVGFGLTIGAALLVIGLRVYENRRTFAQVLFGGGIGTFYITGFAAFQLYALVPYPVAFGFMVAVTLLALFLSLRQSEASLSLIGALGGLGTPFILYNEAGTLGGLVLYTCLILAGTGAMYFYKGWVSLLGVSFVGGWMVLLVGFAGSSSLQTELLPGDQRILQLGVTFAWLLLWLAPVAREVLHTRDPAAWPLPAPGPLARSLFGENGGVWRSGAPAHLMSVITPLVALAFTQGIWSLQIETLGWIALGGAALYAFAAFVLRRIEGGRGIAYTQALVALLLLTLAVVLVLDGNAVLFTLAAEAAVLHLVARRLSDRILSAGAHLLFFAAAVWLCGRLASGILQDFAGFGLSPEERPAVFNVSALVDLAVIALAFGASPGVVPRSMIRVYRVLAHVAFLAWLARELLPLPDGDTWTLLSWALYAAGLHVLSRRLPEWGTVTGTHALFAAVALWLGTRLIGGAVEPGSPGTAVFNLWGIADLAVIALAFATSVVVLPRNLSLVYRLAAVAAFSLWLARELSGFPDSGGYLLLAWSAYAVALHLLAGRFRDGSLSIAGHLQFLAAGVLLLGRLLVGLAEPGTVGTPVWSVDAVADLTTILFAALISLAIRPDVLASAYRISAHVALLAFLWRELSVLPGFASDAYVTIAWGLYAVGLLVAGLRLDRVALVRGGMATFFLVVGKLFLVDLAQVGTVWRVLLFLGFGGLFLVLSYYLRSLWRPGAGAARDHR